MIKSKPFSTIILLLTLLLTLAPQVAAPPAAPAQPGWLWGAGSFLTTYEPAQTPTGNRLVRYFDKGRRGADGLNAGDIVSEMVGGFLIGEGGRSFALSPAEVPVMAGGPTYAAFTRLRERVTQKDGVILDLLTADGRQQTLDVSPDPTVTYTVWPDPSTQHAVASPFAVNKLPDAGVKGWPAFLGQPLTEPYWVRSGGKLVLVQPFERRVLTYDPTAAAAWRVQFANAGRDYYEWRYGNPALREDKPASQYTSYNVRVNLNASHSVSIVEDVTYANSSGIPLNSVLLRVVPRHYKAFTLDAVLVGGQKVAATWRDEINLSVPLANALAVGQQVSFTVRFTLRPAKTGVRFGWDQNYDVLTLGDYLPAVMPFENGGWLQYPFNDAGDEGVNPVANYVVTYSSDQPIVVAATGNPTQVSPTEWRYNAPRVRDVAATMSARFSNPLKDGTYRRTVGGVTLYGFFIPEHRVGGVSALDIAARSFAWYSSNVGAYPHASFIVSEMALSPRCGNYAMEYPMATFLQPNRLGAKAQPYGWDYWQPQHEVAHAWFYGTVGNDQSRDPWLDEAMATALNLDYIRATSTTRDYTAAQQAMVAGKRSQPVSSSVFDFASAGDCVMSAPYFYTVYSQGAGFLQELQRTMGPDAYATALRDYYRKFTLKRATNRDFAVTFQAHTAVNLTALFSKYLAHY